MAFLNCFQEKTFVRTTVQNTPPKNQSSRTCTTNYKKQGSVCTTEVTQNMHILNN